MKEEKILRLEITDKCNMNCSMCWSTKWNHTEMTWDELHKLIFEYASLYPRGTVVLTSREPLLSVHFKKVVSFATELNLKIKLLTNGSLLNDDFCDFIMKSNIDFISVSIHGSKTYHNEIMKKSFAYDKTIQGLKLLNMYKDKYKKNKPELRITTVINRNLLSDMKSIIQVAKEQNASLRLQHLMWHNRDIKYKHKRKIQDQFGYVDTVIDGFLDNIDISFNDVTKILEFAKEEAKKQNVDLQVYPGLSDSQIRDWYSHNFQDHSQSFCSHVKESIRVRANGDVVLCQYIDKNIGNIKVSKLEDIINGYKKISDDLLEGKLFPICSHCCHLRNYDNLSDSKENKYI